MVRSAFAGTVLLVLFALSTTPLLAQNTRDPNAAAPRRGAPVVDPNAAAPRRGMPAPSGVPASEQPGVDATVALLGMELTPFNQPVRGLGGSALIGLKVGRIDPSGPARNSCVRTNDVIAAVYDPDANATFKGYRGEYVRSSAELGAFIDRLSGGGNFQIMAQVRLGRGSGRGFEDDTYSAVAYCSLSVNRSYSPGPMQEVLRDGGTSYGMERNRSIGTYISWYEDFKATDAGKAAVEASLPPPTPRGTIVGKKKLSVLDNDIDIYYDNRLCNNLSPEEVDVYLMDQKGLRFDRMLKPFVIRSAKGFMNTFCRSAVRINLFLGGKDGISQREYRIEGEGRVGNLWDAFVNGNTDYAWALDDPGLTPDKRPSLSTYGFDPGKYYYKHTLQNIIDHHVELAVANPLIAGNLNNMFAHYAVAYGRSKCARNPVKYKLTRDSTTRQTLFSGFVQTWTNTHTDEILLDPRHVPMMESAFDARSAVINPINLAMWDDMLALMQNHDCASPLLPGFENNLNEVRARGVGE